MGIQYVDFDWCFNSKAFGQDVRKARIGERLTQAELAGLLGVAPSTVSTWENGANGYTGPEMGNFVRVCNLFDLRPGQYFDLDIP